MATSTNTVQILDDGLALMMKTASGPPPRDPFENNRWNMAGAHSALFNGLRTIYNQASTIPKRKEQDFIGFCLQWFAWIEHHHHFEEHEYFPRFGTKFETATILEEHATFSAGLEAFGAYLETCLPVGTVWGSGSVVQASDKRSQTPAAFDVEKFKGLIDAFTPAMVKHLSDEIIYLEPSKMRSQGITDDELSKILSDVEAYMQKQSVNFTTFTVITTPKSLQWPDMPWFVRSLLVPWVFYWSGRRWWQFAPKE